MTPTMRNLTLRRRKRDRWTSGSAAIEFAFVAPVFFALMLGILQIGTMIFGQFALQNAVIDAGRMVRTGQAQAIDPATAPKCTGSNVTGAYPNQQAWFDDQICCGVAPLLDCSKLHVNVSSSSTGFGAAGFASTMGANGLYSDVADAYSPGNACDVVLIRATYAWPVWFPGLAQLLNSNNSADYLVNMANNSHLISGTSAFRNEPFTSGVGGC
jgi:Flp pilus assembly protein TadG